MSENVSKIGKWNSPTFFSSTCKCAGEEIIFSSNTLVKKHQLASYAHLHTFSIKLFYHKKLPL